MSAEEDAGSKLRALGWRQGALIPVPEGSPLAELVEDGVTHALVASQDCDIVALTATEPGVDLLPAVLNARGEGDLQHGKNSRRLCMALANEEFVTVDIRHRLTVPKIAVADIGPLTDAAPTLRERKLLAKWLGKRYARPAFPDTFNERLRAQKSNLDKLSKKEESKLITAVFMMLNTEDELASDAPYEVVVWFACRRVVAEDVEQRVVLEKYAKRFAEALDACVGIEVVEYELKGHFEITVEDLEVMKRFDYDFRSEAPKPGGETAPRDAG